MGETHFDREVLIAEVAKRHKILLDPDDPAFALNTINEIVLSRALAIVEAKFEALEQRLAQVAEKQTEAAKAIGENIITAATTYIADRLKESGADLLEKLGKTFFREQGPSETRCAHRTIWICIAVAGAFAFGFLTASVG